MRRPLEDKSRVRTTSGLVGTVQGYTAGDRFLTISSGNTTFEIDRCAICEVLPPKGWPTQESKGDDSKGKSKSGGT
jgi:preprotein translocase subunit YajC